MTLPYGVAATYIDSIQVALEYLITHCIALLDMNMGVRTCNKLSALCTCVYAWLRGIETDLLHLPKVAGLKNGRAL